MLCVQQAINTRKNNTQQIAVAHLITLGDIFIVSNADEQERETNYHKIYARSLKFLMFNSPSKNMDPLSCARNSPPHPELS